VWKGAHECVRSRKGPAQEAKAVRNGAQGSNLTD
jgi:hypothetical protein